jgi:hypothetical protein
MTSSFRGSAVRGRFRRQDRGDAGLAELRRRDQQVIDSLKLQAARTEQRDKNFISSTRQANAVAAQNVQEVKALEDQIYKNKQQAISERAQQEYRKSIAEARQLERQAQQLGQFSQTFGSVAAQAAVKLYKEAEETREAKQKQAGQQAVTASAQALSDAFRTNDQERFAQAEAVSANPELQQYILGTSANVDRSVGFQRGIVLGLNKRLETEFGTDLESIFESRGIFTRTDADYNLGLNTYIDTVLGANGLKDSKLIEVENFKIAATSKLQAYKAKQKRASIVEQNNRLINSRLVNWQSASTIEARREAWEALVRTYETTRDKDGVLRSTSAAVGLAYKDIADLPDTTDQELLDIKGYDGLSYKPQQGKQLPLGERFLRQFQEGDDARDERIQKQNRAVNARNRREDLENASDLENWVNGEGLYAEGQERADQSWESQGYSQEALQEKLSFAKANGFTVSTDFLSVQQTRLGDFKESEITRQLEGASASGDYSYLRYLYDNAPTSMQSEIKRKYLPEIADWEKLGVSDTDLENRLKAALRPKLNVFSLDKTLHESFQPTVDIAVQQFYQEYRKAEGDINTRFDKALGRVLDDIDAGKGSYGVTEANDAKTDQAFFTTQAVTGRSLKGLFSSFNKNSNFKTTPAFTRDTFETMDASISQGNPVYATREMRALSQQTGRPIYEIFNEHAEAFNSKTRMRPNAADIYAAPVDDSRMGRLKEYMLRSDSLGELYRLETYRIQANAGVRPTTLPIQSTLESAELVQPHTSPTTGDGFTVMIDGQPAKMGNNADFVVGEKMARALTSLMRQYPDFRISDINSGQRTPEHNAKVGGVANSAHLRGNAIDVTVGSPTWNLLKRHGGEYGIKLIPYYSNGELIQWHFEIR